MNGGETRGRGDVDTGEGLANENAGDVSRADAFAPENAGGVRGVDGFADEKVGGEDGGVAGRGRRDAAGMAAAAAGFVGRFLQRVGVSVAAAAWALARKPATWAVVFVALLSVSMWRQGDTYIEEVSSTLAGIRELVTGDSEQYLAIADDFVQGDFSMSYVEPTGGADRAHRQPGYPALIALAERFGVQGAPDLARMNLAVLVGALWIAFLSARLATGSLLAGLLATGVVYEAHFLFDLAVERLLSEPLYVALALPAVAACYAYVARLSAASLMLAAAFTGLAYLVRVNGLFLAAAVVVAIVVADLRRARRSEPEARSTDLVLHLPLAAYGAALGLFVVVTAASWVPRTFYAGNPVYHGYLSNFLWVDEYDRAHVPGPPQFGPSVYVAEHGVGEALSRFSYGVSRVLYETPRDKLGIVTSLGLLMAIAVVVALRDRPGLVILSAGLLQAMPLVWTALSNPAQRVAAASLLPFAAMVVAAAAAAAMARAERDGSS